MKHLRNHILLLLLLSLAFTASLQAQSIVVNPSFEISGSGGVVFGGWNQYGQTSSTDTAAHGFVAARVSGLSSGAENESGYWQQFSCDVGERWQIGGFVSNPLALPLTGDCIARVKVEWFNSSGTFIDLDTYTVADASTPTGQFRTFSLLSAPAPAGTTALRLVLSVLQSATAPAADVYYDQITCYSTSAPTIDDVQWDDFPSGRTIEFSNKTWRVKGSGNYGPGPNNFSHQPESVWVDAQDRLHLSIKQISGAWYSTEVTLVDTLGYGDYIFTTLGSLDLLDSRTVLGLFLWQYQPSWDPGASWWNPYNEIDIEYSRWGNPTNDIGQFVAQPWDWAGNIIRYDAEFGATEVSSHAFRWLPDSVEFRSWRGGPEDETTQSTIFTWNYFGPHIPRPEQPRVHLNLWYMGSPPSTNQEVILPSFTFISAYGNTASDDMLANPIPAILHQNYPNPFNPLTTISFELSDAGRVKLEIFDIRGRKVATLTDETKQAGNHTLQWNASDQPSGVYLYRLTTPNGSLTRKSVLAK